MRRGEVWWASLPDPLESGPDHRRPVVIIQDNSFNESRIGTVVVAAITSDMKLAAAPGNVAIGRKDSMLQTDSVADVSQILTLDKRLLTEKVSKLPDRVVEAIDDGLRLVIHS